VDVLLYSVVGAFIYLIAWTVPGHLIAKPIPRVVCQLFTVIVVAFFLPAPDDPKVAFLAGQYAFGGGVILVGLWSVIQKIRSR